MVKEIYI